MSNYNYVSGRTGSHAVAVHHSWLANSGVVMRVRAAEWQDYIFFTELNAQSAQLRLGVYLRYLIVTTKKGENKLFDITHSINVAHQLRPSQVYK